MPAAIFAGGFIGTVARAELAQALPAGRDAWPWATLVVNVLGAFLVGMVATHVRAGGRRATLLGPLLGTGLCGALTTFSALQLELLGLLEEGESARAITYISVSLVAGLAAVAAGTAVVRRA